MNFGIQISKLCINFEVHILYCCRSGKHNVNDIQMSYAVQNDEDGKCPVLMVEQA